VNALQEKLQPFLEVWTLYVNFDNDKTSWKSAPIISLVPDEFEKKNKTNLKDARSLTMVFQKNKLQSPMEVSSEVQEQLELNLPFLPLVRALCIEGMKERHWNEVFNILNVPEEDRSS